MSTHTSTLTPSRPLIVQRRPRRCAVSLRGITKSYGDSAVVRDLNLDIAAGEFFSMLGPSGCGKTTTLRMIGGFVDPTYGEVSLHGKDVTDLPPNRRDVNTVFQSYALFDHLSIWDNVAFGLRRRKVGKAEITQARRRDARTGPAHRSRQGQAERAVRWPAAARCAGAGAGQPPVGAAARRAARRARPQAAQGDAGGAQAHPARGRHHLRVRHARPGGGADDVRPDRGHERAAGCTSAARPRTSTNDPPRASSRSSSAPPT